MKDHEMPAGELLQISSAIGELRAETRNLSAVSERNDENARRLEQKIDGIAAQVAGVRKDLDRFSNTGRGFLIGLTISSAGIGGAVATALHKLFPTVMIAVALVLGSCTSPDVPTLDDARDDALAALTFAAPTPELRAIRSAYVLGAVALYAAHAVERHSGPSAPADAERFLYRLDVAADHLADLRRRAGAGKARHLGAALHAIEVVELAELAIEPTARAYRDRVLGLVATPQPIAIARSVGGALQQIARVEFVREALVADARAHALDIATRGEVIAADWPRALEPVVYACARLADIARRQPGSLPQWCKS